VRRPKQRGEWEIAGGLQGDDGVVVATVFGFYLLSRAAKSFARRLNLSFEAFIALAQDVPLTVIGLAIKFALMR